MESAVPVADDVPLIAPGPASDAPQRPDGFKPVSASDRLGTDADGADLSPCASSSSGTFVTLELGATSDGPGGAGFLAACFRKVSRALLPIFFLLNCLNFIDRTNLSFAGPEMQEVVTQDQFGTGASVFFIGYCLCQLPSQIVLRRVGAPLWLGVIVTAWGLVAVSMAGINGVAYFYAARFLLGITEAGSFPGTWFYVSGFYPDSRITFPYSVMDSAIMVAHVAQDGRGGERPRKRPLERVKDVSFAQVIGAPIAGAVLEVFDGVLGLAAWRWLFLLEGLPTVALGLSLFFLLPSSPMTAKFLAPHEAEAVQAEVDRSRSRDDGELSTWRLVVAAVSNPQLLYISGVKFMKDATSYGAMFWTPTLVKSMLYHQKFGGNACESYKSEGMEVLPVLLTGIPFALAAVSCLAVAKHSQIVRERVKHIGIPYISAGVIFMLLPVLINLHLVLGFVGLTSVIVLALCANGVLVSLASAVADGPGLSISLAVYNSIANAGGVVGPKLIGWVGGNECRYDRAYLLLGAMLVAGGVAILFLQDPRDVKERVTADPETLEMVPRSLDLEAPAHEQSAGSPKRIPVLHTLNVGDSTPGKHLGSDRA